MTHSTGLTNATVATGTILDRIVADKREELGLRQREEPLAALMEKTQRFGVAIPFAAALRGGHLRLIAEIKKASPTKGMLENDLDPVARARQYAQGGAAAISVLTETRHFLGRLEFLETIRADLDNEFPGSRPALLRKDFLFDPYQIYEAKAYGADALLLIVAILPDDRLRELLALTNELGMSALVEVHDETELERAAAAGADVIGINNRDLHTFHTSIEVTERLCPLVTGGSVVVSESGFNTAADAARVRRLGVDAVLVGEALMTSADVVAKMRDFMPA